MSISKFVRFSYKFFLLFMLQFFSIIQTFCFRVLMKVNQIKYGKGIRVYNSIPILQINRKSGNVEFGKNLIWNSYTDHSWNCRCKVIVKQDASLVIGDDTGVNGVMIYVSKSCHIGKHVKIGGGTRIFDTDHHSLDYMIRRHVSEDENNAKKASIRIEDDAFVGAGCFIGKGVTIGARSIIAAGSVVVKSIPADCIAGGNPCKVIKKNGQG